jgi:HSP20 family protein
MNQLFDKFFHSRKILGEGAFLPAIDIAKSDGKITLTAELPGMAESDLNVSVENGILTLKGEKKDEKETKEKNRYRVERSYGTFQRSFTLPKGVKAEDISAKLKDGVLKVSIPEPEEPKPKSIPVTGE